MILSSLLSSTDDTKVKPDRISHNSLWILSGHLSQGLIAFVTIFFLSRYLGPERFGLYSVALSLSGLLIPLTDLGFDLSTTRAISANPASLKQELSKTVSSRSVLSIGYWAAAVCIAVILGYPAELVCYVALMALSLLAGSLALSFVGAIRAIRKMKYESFTLLIGNLVKMSGILIMILLRADLWLIIIAHLAGSIVFLISAVSFLKTQIGSLDFKFDLGEFGPRLKRALPFGLAGIFVTVYFKIDTVMLSKMTGIEAAGYYNAAYNIILSSMILSTPLVVSTFPVIASLYGDRKEEADGIFARGMVFSILIGLPLGIGTFLMSRPLVSLAYGAQFENSIILLMIMSATIPVLFTTHFMGNSLGAAGFQVKVTLVAGINMVFNIILNIILIPKFGARGAGLATLATELLGMTLLIAYSWKVFSFKFLADVVKIAFCCILATVLFILFSDTIGPWLSAVVFTFVFSVSAVLLKVVTVNALKGFLRLPGANNEKLL